MEDELSLQLWAPARARVLYWSRWEEDMEGLDGRVVGGVIVGSEAGAMLIERIVTSLMAVGFCRWKFVIRSGLKTSSLYSQLLSASGYPSHLSRYCNRLFRPTRLESSTPSTTHSSLPSMISGSCCGKFSPCSSVAL